MGRNVPETAFLRGLFMTRQETQAQLVQKSIFDEFYILELTCIGTVNESVNADMYVHGHGH
jgi:hypothetical protein